MSARQPAYTIKVVAERTGIPLHTLRAWERRYGVPKPLRGSDNRYRLYDEDDIADVLWMKRQTEAGLSPSQASAILRQQRAGLAAPGPALHGPRSLSNSRRALEDAVLEFDERTANRVLDEAFALYSLEQVALQIIAPAMHSIGERWMRDEIAVGQEHFASNLLRQRLLTALQAQPAPSSTAPLLVAACAPEEQHELGLLLFALLARRQGWRVTYLGQRTPLDDLLKVSQVSRPRAVLVSVTTVIGLANLIPLLDENTRPAAPLFFGGNLLEVVPALQTRMPGFYVGSDPAQALQAIERAPAPHQPPHSRRHLAAALALREAGMELATRTFDRLASSHPKASARYAGALTFATLFLVDALACALAYDTPELIDVETLWLRETMPPRAVPVPLLEAHLSAFERAAETILPKSTSAAIRTLVARMHATLARNGETK